MPHFRISTHLKDIIGRDLVTNPFVAVFELVKNGLDANASRVDIGLDLDADTIWIVDDGKGMDDATLRDRWLFVAYSAKADGTEDRGGPADYRDSIRPTVRYAGSKGIGRFSCDTLGASLTLYSRTSPHESTAKLAVDWDEFELDSRALFDTVGISLESIPDFPADSPVPIPRDSGTVLRIDRLRTAWDLNEIRSLRRYLGKLIDPFGTTQDTPVNISVIASSTPRDHLTELQGPVGNDIRDLLSEKTTRIVVRIDERRIHTELVDRGRTIYRVSESSQYDGLAGASISAEVFYLNRSAKQNFTRRMGVRSVEFGSVFLFPEWLSHLPNRRGDR